MVTKASRLGRSIRHTAVSAFFIVIASSLSVQAQLAEGTSTADTNAVHSIVALPGEGGGGGIGSGNPFDIQVSYPRSVPAFSSALFDATASTNDRGPIEAYRWTILSKPSGSYTNSSSFLPNNVAAAGTASFVPDAPGSYYIELRLEDEYGFSRAFRFTVGATWSRLMLVSPEDETPAGTTVSIPIIFDGGTEGAASFSMAVWFDPAIFSFSSFTPDPSGIPSFITNVVSSETGVNDVLLLNVWGTDPMYGSTPAGVLQFTANVDATSGLSALSILRDPVIPSMGGPFPSPRLSTRDGVPLVHSLSVIGSPVRAYIQTGGTP